MSKPRLPLSVLAALGLSASAMECNRIPIVGPCLSMVPVPEPGTDADTSAEVNQRNNEEPYVGPCLSPPPEPPIRACLTNVPEPPPPAEPPVKDPREEPPVGPCLSPMREPEPEMTVCLSIAPIDPSPHPVEPAPGDKSAQHSVDKAKQAVLRRGTLPADVAARLLRNPKD